MNYLINGVKLFWIMAVIVVLINSSEDSNLQWYKGNLHTHSYWSDGNDYPEMIMRWYKDQGYDFVALSDHNILAEGDHWIEVQKGTERAEIFRNYLETFGENWVEFEEEQDHYRVKLKTLDEYRKLFEEDESFLIIKSEEITDEYEGNPVHLNVTNIRELIEPQGGNSVAEVLQNNIDAVIEQRDTTGEPMFPHVNHPNYGWAVNTEDLKQLEGERFFEIYNGHPLVHNFGDSIRSGTEQMWDEVVTHYLHEGKPVMYGIAVDDAHQYHRFDPRNANPGRGWIYVKSASLTPDDLISAMERGEFYSTTGVVLKDVRIEEGTLKIEIDEEEGVNYTTRFVGTRADRGSPTGELFKTVRGSSASYTMSGNELYVRAKIISDKEKVNPYMEGEYEVAWTQPVIYSE